MDRRQKNEDGGVYLNTRTFMSSDKKVHENKKY
jgi:hypothetical protein